MIEPAQLIKKKVKYNISEIEQEEESSTNIINLKPTKELSNEA